jgi:hypothetical protein
MEIHWVIFIILTAFLDRLRGSGAFPKGICQVIYGLVVGYYLCTDPKFFLPFAALFVAGCSPGWGQPMGAYLGSRPPELEKKEVWQFGSLPAKPFLSVLVRGLIWALPPMVLAFWYPGVWIFSVSIAIAFPLAAMMARDLIKVSVRWYDRHEIIRGFLLGVFCVAFKILYLYLGSPVFNP